MALIYREGIPCLMGAGDRVRTRSNPEGTAEPPRRESNEGRNTRMTLCNRDLVLQCPRR